MYKLKQVEEVVSKNNIDIICLQEVEIAETVDLSLLELNGYAMEVEKGQGKRRTMMYIRNTLHYQRNEDKEKPNSHVILITVKEKNKTIKIASLYRAFKLTTQSTHKEEFADQLEIVKSHLIGDLPGVLIGDFNIDYNRKGNPNYNHHVLCELLSKFEDEMHMTQLVKFNTWRRIISGEMRTSLLDHVYENVTGLINNVSEISTSTSDHSPLLINLAMRVFHKTATRIVRNWSTYNKEDLIKQLSETNWEIDCLEVQDFNNILEQKLMVILEKLIPFEEKRVGDNNFSEPKWLADMKRKRKNLFKNATRRNNTHLFMRCREMDKKIKREETNNGKKRIQNKIMNGRQNGLWDAVRMAQNKPQNPIPTEMKRGENTFKTDESKAQGFADFFKRKVEDIVAETEIDQDVFNGSKMVDATSENFFTYENVTKAMQSLKDKSSYGLDNIPVKVLRDGYEILSRPYHRLLNKIYDQRVIPEQWKTSRVLPLYKRGKKNQIENYRPISNLCAGSKVLERLMLTRILQLDEQTDGRLTGHNQHGFKKNRSTITASIDIQSKVAALMDRDQYVAMASLDLSAAFDVVNVDLLLKRLKLRGIPEDITGLLESWLKNRLSYVEVGNCCSQYFDSNSGTVQGSILGPVLFSLFMSPLLEIEDMISYADDSYLIKGNKNKQIALQRLSFQLKKAKKWLTNSGLKVNVEKTELIIFHRTDTATTSIRTNGVDVQSKREISVLGILFDAKMEWAQQVEKAARKARTALQGLRLISKFFTVGEKLTLLTTFFYSRLYYGSQIWLLPSLKKTLKSKLFSASGNALKLLEKDASFKDLHKKYNRATPTQFQKYSTAVSFYDLIRREIPEEDWINLQFNIQNDRRNSKLTFHTNNNYRCGFNCLSNRFRSITNEIEKDWTELPRDMYKARCKKRLITEKLLAF